MPRERKNLCNLAYLRNLASNFDVEKIRINKYECFIAFKKKEEILDKNIADNLSEFNAKLSFDSSVKVKFNVDKNIENQVQNLIRFFEKANEK